MSVLVQNYEKYYRMAYSYVFREHMLVVIPVCSLICGMAAFWMVRQMNRTASRYIVKPIVELAADSVRIGDNDFTGPDVVAEGEDEISRLVQEFCRMKASTRECLSLPGQSAPVERPYYVKAKAMDREGNEFIIEGEELMARALCHEIDHLDGILYIDKALPREEA